jgi:hypothetical protein
LGEVAAVSEDTPYMAKVLVKRMKANPNIDVNKHWKVGSKLNKIEQRL